MNWRHKQYLETYKLKRMYRKIQADRTTIKQNTAYEGERIEQKIERIVTNKDPIKDGAPRIYTERKDGVQPQYDIRTDRWEVAVDAMDKVNKSHQAKRENRMGQKAMEGMTEEQKAEYVKDKPNIQWKPMDKKDGGTGNPSQ